MVSGKKKLFYFPKEYQFKIRLGSARALGDRYEVGSGLSYLSREGKNGILLQDIAYLYLEEGIVTTYSSYPVSDDMILIDAWFKK